MFPTRIGSKRPGLTLVELLVVIGVIVVLMAVAIPVMRFDMKDRHIREASRVVNAYIVTTQSRAAEKNRPVGVWFERRNGSPGESIRMFTAEVPPPYIGDTPNARAEIQPVANINAQSTFTAKFDGRSSLLQYLVSIGDVIRFDYKGPYYPITAINTGTGTVACSLVAASSDPRRLPPPSAVSRPAPTEVPYQILRAAQKASNASVELPRSASIDLNVSGLGPLAPGVTAFAPSSATDTSPIVIMFSPSGRIDHIRMQGQPPFVPQETVHLLIGREELIDQLDPTKNLGGDLVQDDEVAALTNLWVSIGAETGSVTTQEMAPSDPAAATLQQRVQQARQFANEKQLMGGG